MVDVDTTGLIIATSLDSRPARPLSHCMNRQGTKRIGEAESLADTQKKSWNRKDRRREEADRERSLQQFLRKAVIIMQI